jgi:hypothetical protein
MKEYRLGKFWEIFVYLFCLGLIGGSAFLIKAIAESTSVSSQLVFSGIAGVALFLAYYLYKEARFGKFVIVDDRAYMVSAFSTRTLAFNQVKGFRSNDKYIIIYPNDRRLKKINISIYLKNTDEIIEWLSQTFPNLDLLETEEETKQILTNAEFGITEEQRWNKIAEAKKVAKFTNGAAWVLVAWLFFYPKPYYPLVIAAMIFPFLITGVCYLYRGMMKNDDTKNSAYPSVAVGFLVSCIVLMLRSLLDINIMDYSNGWLPMSIVALALYVLYQLPTGGFTPKKGSDYFLILFILFVTFAYAFGLVTMLNGMADQSPPTAYETTVASKRISSGKTTSYYLDLKPWNGLTENEEVKVSSSEYEITETGDFIDVYQFKGYFKMPWIVVELRK